jgi:uncharacterized membrane protein YdjX (TVP38/TMEM64 family)
VDVRVLMAEARNSWLLNPPLFLTMATILPLMLFPLAPVGILAGALFSPPMAFLLVYVSSVCGALLAFAAGRALRGSKLGRHAQEWEIAARIFEELRARGFETVFLVRLCPVIPYAFIYYLSGLAAMKLLPFFGATALGLLASTALHVYEGTLVRGVVEEGVQSRLWQVKIAVLIVGLLCLLRVARRLRGRFAVPSEAVNAA